MKELTHEDWMKNPTPRMMWVWDGKENSKEKRKVIYISEGTMIYPVIALCDNGIDTNVFEHCAEIVKARRMTNKELSRWLSEKPHRECSLLDDSNDIFVYSIHTYLESSANKEVDVHMRIRENDGEWREPLIEEE